MNKPTAAAEPKWLGADEDRAWRGWLAMYELVRSQIGRDLQQDCGLSDADYVILVQLSESAGGELRMSDLALRLRWSKSRLSHQVARMEARGLVARTECPSDGRGSMATLTGAGRAEIEGAAPWHVASVRRNLIDLLTPDQLRSLADISDTVLAHLAPPNGDGACPSPHCPL